MKSFAIKISACLITGSALFFAGCKKGNEYYTNPNLPTNATVQNLLTSLEVSTMNSYESDIARSTSALVQHSAGVDNVAIQVNNYSLSETQWDLSWSQLYQAINTGEILVDKAANSPRYRGIAKVCLALNWGLLTDIWGDVPYTEAVSGVRFPQYDSQEEVLNGIQTLLDEAITDLQSVNADNIVITGADDVIFSGDAAKWIKTAWTLKARYLNRLSNKADYNPTAILDALSKGIIAGTDDCMAKHGKNGTESNQWWAFIRQRTTYYRAAKPFVDSISLRPLDQRLGKYFHPFNGSIVGSPVAATTQSASAWGSYLIGASDDAGTPFLEGNAETAAPLVTSVEALFIAAEILARQGNILASDALNNAIMASCTKVTGGSFNGAAIATYTPVNTNLSRVMYEKWIAMFGQCEAYSDYRRTGMPELTPNPIGVTAGHAIPERFPTPSTERTANPNAPLPSILEPVWWAQ
ncbi:MAG: SusD/RagB family nutrient-binding outer membrane lipoprotein [Bacteroidota bacterium]